ncbi:MAG: aminoglycoside adenylyltransferase domain-containing protein, partial [Dehalococcoidia bacterium]
RILRERGITVAGPPPADLVDPVSDADLRLAVRESLEAWAIHLDDPAALRDTLRDAGRDLPARARGGYQPYVVLTMCRALYTLEAGGVASKPEAGAWARHILGEPSASLIAWALTWRPDTHTDRSDDIVAVVRVTLDRARRLDEPGA